MCSDVNKCYHKLVGLRLKHKIWGIMSPAKLLLPQSPVVEAQKIAHFIWSHCSMSLSSDRILVPLTAVLAG